MSFQLIKRGLWLWLERGSVVAISNPVRAAWPAAGPGLARGEIRYCADNAFKPGRFFFRIIHPTNPFVSGERSDGKPLLGGIARCGDMGGHIIRKRVYCAGWQLISQHVPCSNVEYQLQFIICLSPSRRQWAWPYSRQPIPHLWQIRPRVCRGLLPGLGPQHTGWQSVFQQLFTFVWGRSRAESVNLKVRWVTIPS